MADGGILEKILPKSDDRAYKKARGSFWAYCQLINPRFFRDGRPHLKELADTLQALYEGKLKAPDGSVCKRLAISEPPRHGKSYTMTLFNQWAFGRNQGNRIINVSYNHGRNCYTRHKKCMFCDIITAKGPGMRFAWSCNSLEENIMSLRHDADLIIQSAIKSALPDTAVQAALKDIRFNPKGRIILVALGKAAWQMAKAAHEALSDKISDGIVITKYDHLKGDLGKLRLREAGHPVPDENSFRATEEAIRLVSDLDPHDSVLLLISGGGSALFEQPLISAPELQSITDQLLRSGADIVEMNTIRKRLSRVKGGRFAQICEPASVYSVVLSDIIGDPLDMIASGPAYPDSSSCSDALHISDKYQLLLSQEAQRCLMAETPKELSNVQSLVTGSVRGLCTAAAQQAREMGYEPHILTASLSCQAREAGSFLASIAQYYQSSEKSLAFIAGGETVVKLKGKGKGGRNQELALSAAMSIAGLKDTAVFSVGSDGTDGPTDAAGGYADQDTAAVLKQEGIDIFRVLEDNDAYHALLKTGGLVITGPTGTNVNDVSVLLIKR